MAAGISETFSFLNFFGQVFTVVLGWVVVHKLTAARDQDKARKEIIAKAADSLSGIIDQLLLDARSYHLSNRSLEAEVKIKMQLQDLSLRLSSLSCICQNHELVTCRSLGIRLKQAITGEHFEDEHTTPVHDGSPLIQGIAGGALNLKQALLSLKHIQFSIYSK